MADYIISEVTLLDGKTVELKDAVARAAIQGGTYFLGVTSTELLDGYANSEITINGETVTAHNGNMVAYGNKEFVYSDVDNKWHELGDLTNLGDLALKDTASVAYTPAGTIDFNGGAIESSGTFTPAGSVSKPAVDVSPTMATISEFDTAGSVNVGSAASMVLPIWNATLNGEQLVFSWNQGAFTANVPTQVTLPTSKDTSVMTGVSASLHEAPSFSGTESTVSVSGTASGTATFSGTESIITVS